MPMHVTLDAQATRVAASVLYDLRHRPIRGEWTNDGFPTDVHILDADRNGITICEMTDEGEPIRNATWHVGIDEIVWITVL